MIYGAITTQWDVLTLALYAIQVSVTAPATTFDTAHPLSRIYNTSVPAHVTVGHADNSFCVNMLVYFHWSCPSFWSTQGLHAL